MVNNPLRLTSDFYLKLLSLPVNSDFRVNNQHLYAAVRDALADSLNVKTEIVQDMYERMADEDAQTYCR